MPRMKPASVLPMPVANCPKAPALHVCESVPNKTSPGVHTAGHQLLYMRSCREHLSATAPCHWEGAQPGSCRCCIVHVQSMGKL